MKLNWKSIRNRILSALKDFFTKDLLIKVIALIFATLMWGYVLTDQKPHRNKTISGVSTYFDGEAELQAQGLCVRGDRSTYLQPVTVTASTEITNYATLGADQVSARISLRNISEPREYDLPITASVASSLGTVRSVSPSRVTVEIDQLRNKNIEVTFTVIGELPEGYWADTDALKRRTTMLTVSGPRKDIARIVRAECVVDLTDRTSDILNTYDVILYDANGEEISSDILIGTLPSVTVSLSVYATKTVPIDVEGALVGMDSLASNYEVDSVRSTPSSVRIRGRNRDTVNAVERIEIEPITVTGLNAPLQTEADLIIPDGVSVIDGVTKTNVLVNIREIQQTQTFEQVEIQTRGLGSGLDAYLEFPAVNVTVTGGTSIVSMLQRNMVHVSVDLTGLSEGEYDLQLYPFIRNEQTTVELSTELSEATVHVVIMGNTENKKNMGN